MKIVRSLVLVGLAVGLGVVAGCNKKVDLTFVNGTSNQLDVLLDVASQGGFFVGTAGPTGGRVKYKLEIEKDDLPVMCRWQAGSFSGRFAIDEDTPKEQSIYIDPDGAIGPVDKHTAVRRETRVEVPPTVVDQYEVVE